MGYIDFPNSLRDLLKLCAEQKVLISINKGHVGLIDYIGTDYIAFNSEYSYEGEGNQRKYKSTGIPKYRFIFIDSIYEIQSADEHSSFNAQFECK